MAAFNSRRLLLLRNGLLRLLLLRRRRKRLSKYKKRFWIRRVYAERQQKREFYLLVKELLLFDEEYFFQCFRMSPMVFEELLSWTGHQLQKQTTRMREPIGPRERLCICLRYLVTGDAQITIATSYRMSPAVVGRIINETCEVLWKTLIERGFLKQSVLKKNGELLQASLKHIIGTFHIALVLWMANMWSYKLPVNLDQRTLNIKKPLVSFSWPYATHITNSL